MRLSKKLCLSVLLLCATGLLQAQTAQQSLITLDKDQAAKNGITTEPVAAAGRNGSEARLVLPGTAVFPATAIQLISAPAAGVVESIRVDSMDKVAAGAPVVVLQSAQLLEWQRDYVQASVHARLATEKVRREEALFREGIIAESRLQESRSALASATAALQAQRQTLRIAGMSEQAIGALDKTHAISPKVSIVAPRAGIVVEQLVALGQRVEAGTPLAKLAQQDKLWLELQATHEQAAQVNVGDTVQVRGCTQAGRVTALGTSLQPATQTMVLRAVLPAAASCLHPNQHVEAVIGIRQNKGDAFKVPASALVRNAGKEYVFVREASGFRPVPVTVGTPGETAIVQGPLQPGAQVVTKGIATLKGMWLGLGVDEGK